MFPACTEQEVQGRFHICVRRPRPWRVFQRPKIAGVVANKSGIFQAGTIVRTGTMAPAETGRQFLASPDELRRQTPDRPNRAGILRAANRHRPPGCGSPSAETLHLCLDISRRPACRRVQGRSTLSPSTSTMLRRNPGLSCSKTSFISANCRSSSRCVILYFAHQDVSCLQAQRCENGSGCSDVTLHLGDANGPVGPPCAPRRSAEIQSTPPTATHYEKMPACDRHGKTRLRIGIDGHLLKFRHRRLQGFLRPAMYCHLQGRPGRTVSERWDVGCPVWTGSTR